MTDNPKAAPHRGGARRTRGLTFMMVLAALAGVAGGVGAILFRFMISTVQALFFSDLLPNITLFAWKVNLGIILLPAIGGVLIAPVVYSLAPETRGTGIPQVMEIYTLEGGRIKLRTAILKVIVSAITIGSGGSAGREGPITQIGAVTGSAVGRVLRLNEEDVKLLLVSGVAAGIAGTFNAPLGGALFGIEILQRRFSWRGTPPIILASVVGAGVASVAFGLSPVIPAPALELTSAVQLATYFVLGLIFGVLANAWVRVFYLFQDLFAGLKTSGIIKLALGGALVGVLGMLLPSYGILGVGYQGINLVLAGGITLSLALVLGVAKVLATSLTIGSGGSGGIFAPTLYIGSMFGGVVGGVFMTLFPQASTQVFGYSLSGMAALFAGAARAPITSMIIVPEMTGDWGLLPALMISCITSYYVSSYLLKHSSIYTLKIERTGIDIKSLSVPDYLDLVTVGEVALPLAPVQEAETVEAVLQRMQQTGGRSIPVVLDGRLVGRVTFDRVEKVQAEARGKTLVKEIMMENDPPVAASQTPVTDAMKLMESGVDQIMVLDDSGTRQYIEVFTPSTLVKARKLGLDRSVE